MPIDLDLGGVASAGKPLPEDDYEFQIEDATMKLSEDKNSYNLKLRLLVTSPNENGRIHVENLNVQASTRPFVKAFLAGLWGLEDEDIGNISFNVDEDDPKGTVLGISNNGEEREIVGSTVGGTVKHVDSKGKTYGNVIAWFAA
jgi:hypothetical protein